MAEMVKVTDLLRNLKGSMDFYDLHAESEWFRMMSEKSADDQFPTLMRIIDSEGFTDPIGIRFGREFKADDWEDYGIQSEDDWVMGNGHHRLCVAILLGLDEILVEFGDFWPFGGDRYYHVKDRVTDDDRQDCWQISEFVQQSNVGMSERELAYA